MLRPILAALLAGAALFGATAAQATTHWSVGINLPPAGVVVSNGPRYYVQEPTPVYYAPAPVVHYAPAYRHVYQAPVYYAPPRVVYEAPRHGRHWHHHHHHRHHHGRHHDRHDRWGHGPHRGH